MAKDKHKGPKPVEIAVGGVLSVLLGIMGGALFLALQAPVEVKELPPENERDLAGVYFIRGKSGAQEHQTWSIKKEAVNSSRSGEFEVVEQELNLWAVNDFRQTGGGGGGMLHIKPNTPNFRIADSRLQVALPLEWNVFGARRKIESQAAGTFRQRNGVFTFVPERVYIGACPVPKIFGLSDYFVNKVVAAFDIAPELSDGWAQIQDVSLDGEKLRIVIP